MTAQGEDILAYLDSAITAREEAAYAAPRSPWSVRVDDDAVVAPDGITVAEAFALSGHQTRAILDLIALHQPASVLRRCAADRKLIALHGGNMHSCPATDDTGYLDEWTQFGYDDACPVLRHLAEGYGWTEGER
ncbi:DUF6221 family protein [Streptomyces sp. or20]|uniref:DUF6221 family protein n=1 Tax=Streptomyces sp. or20 TaxID=1828016 RepID=UPI000BF1C4AF|nr:DUF6221 family protein [Streptomyces sp. or20]